jgi:HlyD family secretion protein
MTRRTILLSVAGLALIAVLAFVSFRTDPVPVDLHEVARGPMQITVNADGRTRIREIYEVSAPVAGIARRSPVEVGEAVTEGETVVAVVEPVAPALLDARSRLEAEAALREAEAAVDVAQGRLRQADEDLSFARSHYDRARTLVERGVASVTRLEDAAQALAISEAARGTAQSQLQAASSARDRVAAVLVEPADVGRPADQCCIPLRAPISGVVLGVDQISERSVAMGARLVALGDPTDLEIVADLLSADAVRLRPGARAVVERWGGPEPLEARLRSIDPVAVTKVSALGIEEQRVDAVFDLLTPPERRPNLGGGFAVFLRVVEWETDDALQVPLSALFRHGTGWAVYAVEDGSARRVPVEIGRRGATHAEVNEGLSEGMRIVTHPSEALSDGAAVAERTAM